MEELEPRPIAREGSEIRVNQEEDDSDYIDTLLSDAGVGGADREGSDVAAAAAVAAGGEAREALRASARGTAVPTEWGQGYRVSTNAKTYGHDTAEGAWGMDPAALAVVSANLHRSISLDRTQLGADEKLAIEEAYLHSVRANQDTLLQAYNIRYDFRPRAPDLRNFPSLDPQRRQKSAGGAFALQKGALSWALSVDYEIASRAFDRLWSMLTATRERREVYSMANIAQRMTQIHMQFYRQRTDADELASFLDSFIEFALETPLEAEKARSGAMRLVIRARNIDEEKRQYAHLYEGSVSESALFGSNHRLVEEEALMALRNHAQRLRYLFRHDTAPKAGTLSNRPPFRYEIERVVVSRSADETEHIEGLKVSGANAMQGLQYGVRVVIPPAPEGYLRNNVLIAFRSLSSDGAQDPELSKDEGEELVHMIVVGAVPDGETWIDDRDQENPRKSIADLPASFVMYHTRVFGASHPKKAPDTHHGHVVRGEVSESWWEAVYDLRWLETVSGKSPERPSPVDNVVLDSVFRSLYAYPFRSATAVGAYRSRYPKPWIQVFVEYVPTDATVSAMRRNRAKWFRQVGKKASGPPSTGRYLDPPRSFTGMKEGLPMAPWTKGELQRFADTPIVEDFAGSASRIHAVVVRSDNEKSQFERTSQGFDPQPVGAKQNEEEDYDSAPELDTIISSSEVALDMERNALSE